MTTTPNPRVAAEPGKVSADAADHDKGFALTRPAHVGLSHLRVRDLDMVSSFYQRIIGLSVLEKTASGVVLGAGSTPLLILSSDGQVSAAPRTAAGLFHTAFLMPNRLELAHFLTNAAENGVRLDGASDHLVSEALYLSDPEGNGIEVYADRKPEDWNYRGDGTVEMATLRLDLAGLIDAAPAATWAGMPADGAVGHIHLQVGALPEADRFYEGVLGLKIMARYPGASFFGSGGYHHHVAANIWNSRGAQPRDASMSGLSDYTLRFNDQAALDRAVSTLEALEIASTKTSEGVKLRDPWGIGLTLASA